MPTLPSNFPQKTQKAADTIVLKSIVLRKSAESAGETSRELVLQKAQKNADTKFLLKWNVLRKSAGSAGKFPEVNPGRKFCTLQIMDENQKSYSICGAIFKVFKAFGPGLLESVYVSALANELKKNGLAVKKEVPVPVYYEGEKLEVGFRIDLLVEDKVLIEVKSVEYIAQVHHKQTLTYSKLKDLKLGILVNFNVDKIEYGIFRKVNGL